MICFTLYFARLVSKLGLAMDDKIKIGRTRICMREKDNKSQKCKKII